MYSEEIQAHWEWANSSLAATGLLLAAKRSFVLPLQNPSVNRYFNYPLRAYPKTDVYRG